MIKRLWLFGLVPALAFVLALFGEYRYTFFPGFKLTDNNLTFKTDLNSNSVVAGVSLRF